MKTVNMSSQKEFKPIYDGYTGFDFKEVGISSIKPNQYASKTYQKKKADRIIFGTIQEIQYSGTEHDLQPLILPIGFEVAYGTLLAINLNYVPVETRKHILNYILKTNHLRIRKQKPIVVDYKILKKKFKSVPLIIRRYKTIGIRVVEQFPIVEWEIATNKKGA